MNRTRLVLVLAIALVFAAVPALAAQQQSQSSGQAAPGQETMQGNQGMVGGGEEEEEEISRPPCMQGGETAIYGRSKYGHARYARQVFRGVMREATETMGMMSQVTGEMGKKLSTGQVSPQEARKMGAQLEKLSGMLKQMSEIARPMQKMERIEGETRQMMQEMGMTPPAEKEGTEARGGMMGGASQNE